jgi:hypothetical protein
MKKEIGGSQFVPPGGYSTLASFGRMEEPWKSQIASLEQPECLFFLLGEITFVLVPSPPGVVNFRLSFAPRRRAFTACP